jgi:MFS transporter, FHS family, glucose/mannose:H+ symporter
MQAHRVLVRMPRFQCSLAVSMRPSDSNASTVLSRGLLILMHIGFVVTGIMTTLIGPLLPEFSARWLLSDARAGNLFTAQFLGSMAGVGLSGILATRRGFRFPIALGFAFMGVAAIGLIGASWKVALALLFCNGAGLGLVIPSTNLVIAETNPRNSSAALNLLNFSWGAGATICPFLVAWLIRTKGFSGLLVTLAVLTAILAVVFVFGMKSLPQSRPVLGSTKGTTTGKEAVGLVILLGAMFFLYLGTESSVGGWVALYTRRMQVSPGDFWMLSPSFFWGALLAGRAAAPVWLRWVAEIRLARIGVMVALCGIAILLQASSPVAIATGASLAGFGLAPVYPITIAVLAKEFGAASSRISGLLFALAGLGGAIVPWLVGLVSTHFANLKVGLLVPLFSGGILLILYFQKVERRSRSEVAAGI